MSNEVCGRAAGEVEQGGAARLRRYAFDPHRGKVGKPRAIAGFDQRHHGLADMAIEAQAETLGAFLTQLGCAGLDDVAGDLRHARGGRAGARRIREDVQVIDAAFVHTGERVGEHLVGLGREAGDQVRAESDFGASVTQAMAQVDRVGARMAALHALQDHVVARLEGEMQVWGDALFVGERLKQRLVDLDGIDRGEAELFEVRHELENARDEIAELRRVRQVGAPQGRARTCRR